MAVWEHWHPLYTTYRGGGFLPDNDQNYVRFGFRLQDIADILVMLAIGGPRRLDQASAVLRGNATCALCRMSKDRLVLRAQARLLDELLRGIGNDCHLCGLLS
jgi:hypothetical protein